MRAILTNSRARGRARDARSNNNNDEGGIAAVCGAITIAALLAAATLLTPAAALAKVTPTLDGRSISDAVEDELIVDPAVMASLIDVSTVDGVVTLTGTVNSLTAKNRAAAIAETVKGVRAVVNRIDVAPATMRTDIDVANDVRNALLLNPATDSYEVAVTVADGTVGLTGTVGSWQERDLVEKVAGNVRGVREVRNEIDIAYPEVRTDLELRTEIEELLRWDVLVDHALIAVSVVGGDVTLSGTVGSAAEKSRAVVDAWVPGVESVDATRLEVERWARDPNLRKDKYAVKADDEVRAAVIDALAIDPRVNSFNVQPEVTAGTVTLRGTVDNLKAKRAAETDARNTVGVVRVVNRLKVRPIDPITDADAERAIRAALLMDPYVERYQVTVDVVNGVAYLDGKVDSYFEKAQAGDIAAQRAGVVEVVNNLEVDRASRPLVFDPYIDRDWYVYDSGWYDYTPSYVYTRDATIQREIESELWWSPFVDSDDINVTVVDGTATLTGTVSSWAERRAATENAFEGGAVWVDNDLEVVF